LWEGKKRVLPLDLIPKVCCPSAVRLIEGAVMRRLMVEQDAVPAGGG